MNLKKNILFNFAYQILALILPFITAPYLSRTIGAEGVGVFSFSQSIALYFTYITLLGLSNYGNRAIAEVQDNENKRSKIFFEIYTMQLLAFIISVSLYIIYVLFFSVNKTAAVIMIGWVVSAAFDINWFFFGMELFKLTVVRNTLIKIISVICIFVFVHQSITLKRAKRSRSVFSPTFLNVTFALRLSPTPSIVFISPMPKRSCSMCLPTSNPPYEAALSATGFTVSVAW